LAAKGWKVVRYADDYIFGKADFDPFAEDASIEREKEELFSILEEVLKKYGFVLNTKKSWISTKWEQKPIMGMVDYVKLNIPRKTYDKLKAAVHNFIVKKQVPYAFIDNPMRYLRALQGKVAYWRRINPQKIESIYRELSSIDNQFVEENTFVPVSVPKGFWNEPILTKHPKEVAV